MTKQDLAERVNDLHPDELRALRAIINGKLSRRTISKEQQDAMQAARKRKTS